ncbi:MAG: haloacid dehalogenase-like hydrolase [Candidatus Aenigmatarchaeota archaeon]
MKIRYVVMDCDGLLLPFDSKEELAKQMLKDGTKSKLALYMRGIPTYLALKRVKKYDKAGDMKKADLWAERSFERFDKIIQGLDPEYIRDFGRECAKAIQGRKVIEDLYNKDYELVLISGGIQELTETTLEESDMQEYFKEVLCNPLKIKNGKVKALVKRTSTASKKAQAMCDVINPKFTAAIGHDYWDSRIFSLVKMPICYTGGSWASNSAYEITKERKGHMIKSLDEVPTIL